MQPAGRARRETGENGHGCGCRRPAGRQQPATPGVDRDIKGAKGEDAVHQINIAAAVAAGIVGYFPGALWYSKVLFLRRWAREMGIDIDNPPAGKGNHGLKIAIGVATSIVAAIVFALIAGP